jgi:hypothetical protein
MATEPALKDWSSCLALTKDAELYEPNLDLAAVLESDFDERRYRSARSMWRSVAHLLALGVGTSQRRVFPI